MFNRDRVANAMELVWVIQGGRAVPSLGVEVIQDGKVCQSIWIARAEACKRPDRLSPTGF